MGLLDDYNQFIQPTEDEKKQAQAMMLAQIGAGLLGARKGYLMPTVGQAIGQGLAGYQQSLNKIPEQRLQGIHGALYIQQIEKAKQDAEKLKKQQEWLSNISNPAQSLVNGAGPTIDNSAKVGGFDETKYREGVALGIDPKLLDAYRFGGKDEIKDYQHVRNPDGSVTVYGLGKHGDVLNTSITPFVKPELHNFGGYVGSVDPVTQNVRSIGNVTMSPDQKDTSARDWAKVAIARENQGIGKWSYDPDRGIAVNSTSGQAQPIVMNGMPLEQKEKPMTEAQAMANLYGTRMQDSDKIIGSMQGKYSPMAVNAKIGFDEMPYFGKLGAGSAFNLVTSKENQMAEQAQRNFLNAVLRRESGAVISQSEFANGRLQYFPQPGDTEKVLEQKAANRKRAIEAMKYQAGKYWQGDKTSETPQNRPPLSSFSKVEK